MRLTGLPVAIVVLITTIIRAEIIIETRNVDESTASLVDGLVNIVTSCYGNRIDAVGLAGNLPDTILMKLSAENLIPVALIENTKLWTDDPSYVFPRFRHKLHVFIVEGASWYQLHLIIERNIKYTIWWNHMASFFILDRSPECGNVWHYLLAAWQRDLLNAKVVCYHYENGRIIFNYNPFTSQAPVLWQLISVNGGQDGHPFTLFSREYHENEGICVDLDFEKTKDLGGYAITLQGTDLDSRVHRGKITSEQQFKRTYKRILGTVYRTLNVSPQLTGYHGYDAPNTDMIARPLWILNSWDSTLITYPHEITGHALISQFRGHKSQLDKILSVVDDKSHIGIGIVYLITLIFLKFFVLQALIPAVLNLVRITCNTGIANIPGNTASRIYLTGLLFFVVTMQGIFQGKLATLLTTQVPVRNVDTIKDVVDFGYKIYGDPNMKDLIDHAGLKESFVETYDEEEGCVPHAKNDSLGACIDFAQGGPLDQARKLSMHVSRELIAPTYVAFGIRWDWPLEERINKIIARLVEADELQPWDVKCNPIKLTEFEFDEEVKNNKDFKKIELGELTFAFVILAIGLTWATITFIVELVVHLFQSRIVSVRVQIVIKRRGSDLTPS